RRVRQPIRISPSIPPPPPRSTLFPYTTLFRSIHFKDFYLRPASENPGDGFFQTTAGNYLRGSIYGQGDINVREIIRIIKNSNYDGYISLEFEGMEECKLGTKVGLENMRRLLKKEN